MKKFIAILVLTSGVLFSVAQQPVFAEDLNSIRLKIFYLFNFVGSSNPTNGGGTTPGGGGSGGGGTTPGTPGTGTTPPAGTTPGASTPTPGNSVATPPPGATTTPGSGNTPGTGTTPPANTPPPSGGSPSQSDIQKVVDAISESNIRQYLENLVDDESTPEKDQSNSRFSTTPGNNAKAQYIKRHFEGLGLETELQPFTVNYNPSYGPLRGKGVSGQTNNIIGRLYGQERNKFYLITAHMDATGERSQGGFPDVNKNAPGADDNGSGTSAVMEIARAIKTANIPLKYSIEFILFSGEEQGLIGSSYYVNHLPSGKQIISVMNMDMIGDNRKNPGRQCVHFNFSPRYGGNIISEAVVKTSKDFNTGLTADSIADNNARSDHAPFWGKGIPAIFAFECDFDESSGSSSVYHRLTDTIDNLSTVQIAKTAKAVGGTLAQFAVSGVGVNLYNSTSASTNSVLGDSTSKYVPNSQTLAVVNFNNAEQLDTLFSNAISALTFLEGDDVAQPVFIGLFSDQSLDTLQKEGYVVRVIEQNVDLSNYEYFYHPKSNQSARLESIGTPFQLAEHYTAVKIDPEKAASASGDVFEFFDLHWEPGLTRPPYKTVRITAEPTAAPTPIEINPKDLEDNFGTLEGRSIIPIIIATLLVIGGIALGIFAYFRKKKMLPPQIPEIPETPSQP